ncbi:HAD-like domain-containing protein [Gorgonomyces haynaldii]|nr:HAD-like domain-containing protein [Gorgonomyces haynaldii]
MTTHVLFDMDGLLLDTESIYTVVSSEILQRYGLEYTWELKAQLMGKKEIDAATFLVQKTGLPLTPQQYIDERNVKQNALFAEVDTLPGVEKLVRNLKAHNIKIAVCTSSHTEAYKIKTTKHREFFELFDVVLCGDDPRLKRGKPHPDIFHLGLELLGGTPEDRKTTLVFEDSPSGVISGLDAGMQVVWVPDRKLKQDPELQKRVSLILNSLEEFDPSAFGLPAY